MPQLVERVDNLEYLMAQSQLMFQGLVVEMKDFKDEMKDFKVEMKEFKDEIRNDTRTFKIQTQATIDKLSKELEQDRRLLRRELADIAKKMGTIVEDIVVPCIDFIAEKYFGLRDWEDFAVRRKKKKPADKSKEKEFDIIVVYDDKIILNETKSTPRQTYADDFIEFIKKGEFYEYFPEYAGKKIIPVFAALYVPDNIIKYLSANNILVMAMSGENMDIINPDIVKNL